MEKQKCKEKREEYLIKETIFKEEDHIMES
jgi:hypothetical protein